MNVLLVYPNICGMNMLPPAIALFSSLLKQDGHQVALFDTTDYEIPGESCLDSDKQKERQLSARPFDDRLLRSEAPNSDVLAAFRRAVVDSQAGLVAFSVTEDLFPVAKYLLTAINDLAVPVIMGGVFPTFAPEKCLAIANVTMVCIGEGEGPLPELCRRLEEKRDYTDIPGLWVKSKHEIHRNPLGPPADLGKNPLLDLSILAERRLYRPMQGRVWRMLPVETHRGCPYNCTYCNSPAQRRIYREQAAGRHFRKKPFPALARELHYFKDEMRAEAFYFWADTFLAYTDREFDEFCEIYQAIRLPFWCQCRPEEIDEGRLRRLMGLGLFRMGLGVEHGNEDFRRRILRRTVTNQVMLERLSILDKLGLKYSVNNIIGFPTETRELAMETVRLNREIHSDSTNAYCFSPFHGTPLREMAEKLGYCSPDLIARSLMRPTLLDMPQFPPAEIEGLRRCFVLYVKMPLSRWPEIIKAEELGEDGNRLWQQLRDECAEKYMNYGPSTCR